MLASCNDFLTGQDGEPHGPLKVTKLTLNDGNLSRGTGVVFTDTSVPPDCMAASAKDLPQCNADPFTDKFGVLKSPPNPDSGKFVRVIFNKAPMLLNGAPLEKLPDEGLPQTLPTLSDMSVLKFTCQNCSTDGVGGMGVPPSYNSLQITGTDLSPDPSQFPYGPGLQMEVLPTCSTTAPGKCALAKMRTDAFRALEPGSTYSVVLNPGLSGRNEADKVMLDDAAKALLTFNTEPMLPLVVGIGGDSETDNPLDGSVDAGDGTAAKPYLVDLPMADPMTMSKAQLANEGAVMLALNAAVDESAFTAQSVSASVTSMGATMSVPVMISTALMFSGKQPPAPIPAVKCSYAKRRTLYIAPTGGSWIATLPASGTVTVDIVIKGSEVRDLSQIIDQTATTAQDQPYLDYNQMNPMKPAALLSPVHLKGKGVHVLGSDINIRATLLSMPADQNYVGVLASQVVAPSGC